MFLVCKRDWDSGTRLESLLFLHHNDTGRFWKILTRKRGKAVKIWHPDFFSFFRLYALLSLLSSDMKLSCSSGSDPDVCNFLPPIAVATNSPTVNSVFFSSCTHLCSFPNIVLNHSYAKFLLCCLLFSLFVSLVLLPCLRLNRFNSLILLPELVLL